MIFNTRKAEKEAAYLAKIREWRKVFAWFPVDIDKNKTAWLCFVETRYEDPPRGMPALFCKTQFYRLTTDI